MHETQNPLHALEHGCRDKANAAIHRSNTYWNSRLYFDAMDAMKEAKKYEDMANEISKHPQF